jgi:hypothetical protein
LRFATTHQSEHKLGRYILFPEAVSLFCGARFFSWLIIRNKYNIMGHQNIGVTSLVS